MTEGGKNSIKKKDDHNNWNMERTQFQKEQWSISSGTGHVNMSLKES
jgi:hypothetical protein